MPRFKERWSKGKEAGCVVSDAPNRHERDDLVDYYGGYLVAESIPKQEFVSLIAVAPDLYNKLEEIEKVIKEWPMIHEGGDYLHGWILNSISKLLDEVRGESEVNNNG